MSIWGQPPSFPSSSAALRAGTFDARRSHTRVPRAEAFALPRTECEGAEEAGSAPCEVRRCVRWTLAQGPTFGRSIAFLGVGRLGGTGLLRRSVRGGAVLGGTRTCPRRRQVGQQARWVRAFRRALQASLEDAEGLRRSLVCLRTKLGGDGADSLCSFHPGLQLCVVGCAGGAPLLAAVAVKARMRGRRG